MSFQLQIEVETSRDCASFLFKDSTKLYDASFNPTGYDPTGVLSANPNNLSNFTLEVTNLSNSTNPVTITIPTSAYNPARIPGVVEYTITGTNLGYTIEDGVYKFIYTILETKNNITTTYQAGCYILNDCNICCAMDQKLKDLKNCGTCNDKNNRTVNMLYEAYMLRQKAHHLVSCHDFTGANEVLEYLKGLLDIKTCENCN